MGGYPGRSPGEAAYSGPPSRPSLSAASRASVRPLAPSRRVEVGEAAEHRPFRVPGIVGESHDGGAPGEWHQPHRGFVIVIDGSCPMRAGGRRQRPDQVRGDQQSLSMAAATASMILSGSPSQSAGIAPWRRAWAISSRSNGAISVSTAVPSPPARRRRRSPRSARNGVITTSVAAATTPSARSHPVALHCLDAIPAGRRPEPRLIRNGWHRTSVPAAGRVTLPNGRSPASESAGTGGTAMRYTCVLQDSRSVAVSGPGRLPAGESS